MEKRCKVCGTTEKVSFDGMCKKCYEDSIMIHEKTVEEEREEGLEKNEDGFKWKRSCDWSCAVSCSG